MCTPVSMAAAGFLPPILRNRRICPAVGAAAAAATGSANLSLLTRMKLLPGTPPFLPIRGSKRFIHQVKASSDEEAAAKLAAASAEAGAPTIFDKIISKEIPSTVVYEDDKALAFRDTSPQSPVHVLVIPKFRDGLTQLGKAEERHSQILGHLLFVARIVAEKEGIIDNFRVVINNGPGACQSVYHLHLHVLGGRQMKWPPG